VDATEFQAEIDRVYAIRHQPLPSQGELIGAINERGDVAESDSRLAERIDADLGTLTDRSVETLRQARRRWSALLRNEPAEVVFAATAELFQRFDYRWIAYELLLFNPPAFALVKPSNVEQLAGELRSWGDVDQFGLLVAGPAWRANQLDDGVILGWAQRDDRWWRRVALVATVPLNSRAQGGRGDAARTLALCERLASDRDEMVAKAMSWALRELIVHDRSAVEAFVTEHDASLASRVKREVRNKLATGLKNPSRSANASG
jgi:3-methyladenine DNA glycosylase AlkD